jgi:hypothetical protein
MHPYHEVPTEIGIGERELAKTLFGDEALLNHLKRFGYDIDKVGDVKVREIGAEHRA